MNIGIDIRALKGATGVGRYVKCIFDELQNIDSVNNYFLFESKASEYAPQKNNWQKICSNYKLPSTLWMLFKLPSLLKKYKIDILWAPEQICPVWGMPPKTKIVTTIHDFTNLLYPEMVIASSHIIKNTLIPIAVKKSTALLPVSHFIKDELFKFYPESKSPQKIIRVIGNGAKVRERDIKPRKRENFLFYPANLEPRKNHLRLLKALEKVIAAGFDINIHLSGPIGWKNKELLNQIYSGPIKDRIKYLGFVSDEELLNEYLTCAALIYPSIYEGFGIPIIEALNLDTPVLTSKGTVMEEIAGTNAIYFDPYDIDSIASAIIDFLKSRSVAIDKEPLKKYTWKQSAEKLLEVFTDVYNM